MPAYTDVEHILAFIEQHGYALLFWWVLAEQSAIPLPSMPLLLAVGALVRADRLNPIIAIACCVMAALIGDTLWFALGRRRGRQVLRVLCRVSLEPDSCVRQTENAFLKYGLRSLLVAKFIPGLNAVAAPLAGTSGTPYTSFALYDSLGVILWSSTSLAIGDIFSEQLKATAAFLSRLGGNLFLLVAALLVLWILYKFAARQRFLRQLAVARITPAQLQARLDAGEDVFMVDLRSALAGDPGGVPGAVRMSPEELASHAQEIPRDRDIVLFCS